MPERDLKPFREVSINELISHCLLIDGIKCHVNRIHGGVKSPLPIRTFQLVARTIAYPACLLRIGR